MPTKIKTKKYRRSKKGGKAIAAGGFGCVFNPALKCKGKSRGSGITKVLIKRYADEEINELGKVSPILRRIPNKDDYFLGVDATTCELEPLEPSDKVDFDEKCTNLSRYSINSYNVNTKLNSLAGINLPYGGLDIERFIIKKKLTPENFIKLNNSLIKLLEKAIVPMNQLGLYHNDLKANNILVNDTFQTKIIDWGLSATQSGSSIPNIYKSRPFQFNTPFSICLFHPSFNNFLKNHIRRINALTDPKLPTLSFVKDQIKIIMFEWVDKYKNRLGGDGHYNYWNYLLELMMLVDARTFPTPLILNNKKEILEFSYLNNYIVEGLTEIVLKYTTFDNRNLVTMENFNENAFFNDVYKYNVDVWGLLSVYFSDIISFITGSKRLHNNSLTKEENFSLLNGIKYIASKYIFNTSQQATAMNISDVINDLKSLNNFFPLVARIPSSPPAPPPLPVVAPGHKKTRKKHVVCDDAKKALCRSKGKICNEATGRCNNP